MMNLSDIRAQYPQYHDLSDDQLLIGLHQKFYADIPIGKFTQMVNYDTNKPDPTDGMSGLDKFSAGAGKALVDLGRGASQFGAGVMDAIDPRGQVSLPAKSQSAASIRDEQMSLNRAS
jgi:hypothetical protein